jgi:hypothetical protein
LATLRSHSIDSFAGKALSTGASPAVRTKAAQNDIDAAMALLARCAIVQWSEN